MMREMMAMLGAALAICILPQAGTAQTADAADPASYPDPSCVRPQPPGDSSSENDQSRVMQYNMRVRRYNQDIQKYNSCMHAYVDAANRDVKKIQENATSEIARIRDTANSRIKLIEGKAQEAVRVGNNPSDAPVTRDTRIGGDR